MNVPWSVFKWTSTNSTWVDFDIVSLSGWYSSSCVMMVATVVNNFSLTTHTLFECLFYIYILSGFRLDSASKYCADAWSILLWNLIWYDEWLHYSVMNSEEHVYIICYFSEMYTFSNDSLSPTPFLLCWCSRVFLHWFLSFLHFCLTNFISFHSVVARIMIL